MNGIVLDAELRAWLGDLTEEKDVVDESGRVIARYIPVCHEPDKPHVVTNPTRNEQ